MMTDITELRRKLDALTMPSSYYEALRACGIRPTSGRPERKHHKKMLYFALCGDAVKIGVSKDPEARLETLQTGAPRPLKLLAVFPKKGDRENECHKKLEHLHLSGEWFRYTHEVDALIGRLQNEC